MAFDSKNEDQIGEAAPALSIQKHPAGKFMWSMALGGPVLSWIVHHRATTKSQYGFFWPMIGWGILVNIPEMILGALSTLYEPEGTIGVFTILYWVWYVAIFVIMGKLGAGKMTDCVPDYNPADYKRRERIGIIVGVILIVLALCFSAFMGILMAASGMSDM